MTAGAGEEAGVGSALVLCPSQNQQDLAAALAQGR